MPIYIAACGAIHLIDRIYRKAPADDWTSYAGPGFLIAIFLAGLLLDLNPANDKDLNIPIFKDLEVSTGIFQKWT